MSNTTLEIRDIRGLSSKIELIDVIQQSIQDSIFTVNAVQVQSGLNIATNTEDFETYAFQTKGTNLLHDTLYVYGYTEISNNICIKDNATVFGDISTNKQLYVSGDALFFSEIDVSDNIRGRQNLYLDNDLYVSGKSYLTQDVSMGANLLVSGDASMQSNLDVLSNLRVFKKADIYEDVSLGNTLFVHGDTSLNAALDVIETQ